MAGDCDGKEVRLLITDSSSHTVPDKSVGDHMVPLRAGEGVYPCLGLRKKRRGVNDHYPGHKRGRVFLSDE